MGHWSLLSAFGVGEHAFWRLGAPGSTLSVVWSSLTACTKAASHWALEECEAASGNSTKAFFSPGSSPAAVFVGSKDDSDMSAPQIVGLAQGEKSGAGLTVGIGSQTLPGLFLWFWIKKDFKHLTADQGLYSESCVLSTQPWPPSTHKPSAPSCGFWFSFWSKSRQWIYFFCISECICPRKCYLKHDHKSFHI